MTYTLSQTIRDYEGCSPRHDKEGFLCDFIQQFKKLRKSVGGAFNLTGPVVQVEFKDANGLISSTQPCENIDGMCDALTKWKNETGFDRFSLTTDDDGFYTRAAKKLIPNVGQGPEWALRLRIIREINVVNSLCWYTFHSQKQSNLKLKKNVRSSVTTYMNEK